MTPANIMDMAQSKPVWIVVCPLLSKRGMTVGEFKRSPIPGLGSFTSLQLTGLSLCGLAYSNYLGSLSIKVVLVERFFASPSISPKQGFAFIPDCRRWWAIILVVWASGQIVLHHRHFILGFIPFGIFLHVIFEYAIQGVLIVKCLVTICSHNNGSEPEKYYDHKINNNKKRETKQKV